MSISQLVGAEPIEFWNKLRKRGLIESSDAVIWNQFYLPNIINKTIVGN
tara:strand:+ start:85 stop:231 length:147 start_codon:yes stop_codon:yes gene_type:complete